MKNSLILLLISLFSIILYGLPPQNDSRYKVFTTWKQNIPLTWNDFQAKSVKNAAEVAMTTSSVEFSYYIKNNSISYVVVAKFFPKLSWYKKSKQRHYILEHEQKHFDITELYARLLRKELSENIHSAKDEALLNSIGKKVLKLWKEEQNDYDRETNHSQNEVRQKEWNASITERLAALKEFSSK